MKKEKIAFYKKKKYWALALIFLVLIFGFRQFTQNKGAAQKTAIVQKGTVKEEIILSGEIRAQKYANLAFPASGTLTWVNVTQGGKVYKGQPLAKLDTVLLNASYQQALATLRAAEANVAEVHDDLKGKDSTETFSEKNTRVAAEVAKDKAYEAMVASRKALNDATLVAPFSGVVSYLANENQGVNISLGVNQITLIDPSSIYFLVNADQTEVFKFNIGDECEISFDSYDGSSVKGKISMISFTPSLEDAGTVYPIRITLNIENSGYKYKYGMTGDAKFTISQKDDTLYLPNKFVKTDKNGKYVLLNGGKDKKYLEIGVEGEENVEIKGDISEGTTVFD